jgi:hypothetical protein
LGGLQQPVGITAAISDAVTHRPENVSEQSNGVSSFSPHGPINQNAALNRNHELKKTILDVL